MPVKGGGMNDAKSSKRTNNEIVKSLIAMLQTFTEQQDPEAGYQLTVTDDNGL
jgi:hypothetical protein